MRYSEPEAILSHTATVSGRSVWARNETIIANRIHQAFQLKIHNQRIFWLTLARITELAIYQAGVYADACEFAAAGDLLVNPRCITIHLKGRRHRTFC